MANPGEGRPGEERPAKGSGALPDRTPHFARLSLLVGGMFLLLLGVLFTLALLGLRMAERNGPRVDASMEIKYELSQFHLWFEELVQGDPTVGRDVVWSHLREAEWYARALLDGGRNHEGHFEALEALEPRESIGHALSGIAKLEEVAEARLRRAANSRAGSDLDQLFDQEFHTALTAADRVERQLQELIRRQLFQFRLLWAGLTFLVVGVGGVVWIVLRRYDRRQHHHLKRLDQSRRAAETANQAKSAFLAHMSHEVRTPLNAILGMNELLLEEETSAERRRYLETARKAGDSLLTLVNDILDLSRIESGQVILAETTFDLARLAENAIELLRGMAIGKGIGLVLDWEPGSPGMVRGDPNRLRQVLLNLLNNAVKFTEKGEVRLSVGPGPAPGVVRFTVADTGIGMPPQKLEAVFQPFFQVDDAITRRYGGAGLGLAICRRLVEAMAGTIQAESHPGKGSRLRVDLPLATMEALPVNPVGDPSSSDLDVNADPDGAGLSILLVEDNEDNRLLIKAFLKQTPHRLLMAVNGAEGLKAFKTEQVDLVLMDVLMPVMDGLTACRKMRRWEAAKGQLPAPIIALTAHAMQEDIAKSLAAGCDRHLVKPIGKAELLEAIGAFGRKRGEVS